MKNPIIEEEELKLFDCDGLTPLGLFLLEEQPDKVHNVTFVCKSGKRIGPYRVKLEHNNKGLRAKINKK